MSDSSAAEALSNTSISNTLTLSSSSFSSAEAAVNVVVRETPLEGVLSVVHSIWSFNLSTVDGSEITIGKVVIAILLTVLGFYSSGRISRWIVSGVLRKTKVHEGAAAAFQSISFYLLVTTFTIGALTIVHIPLTVFTLVGGALAIGLGFGSQNLASNFISGIILLFEQPVRVGDIIEVDGVQGSVVSIGLRSTIMRTPSNLDVVVPNISLLDRKIVNWTLSDSQVRRSVTMNIAYGADVRQVEDLVLKIVAKLPEVAKYPAPGFFVTNLGALALECELRFWMSGRSISECLRMESEIRIAILNELARTGAIYPLAPIEQKKS